MVYTNEQEFISRFSATSREQAERYLYKYSPMDGIRFEDDGVTPWSHIEGSAGDGLYGAKMFYPFTSDQWETSCVDLEKLAHIEWCKVNLVCVSCGNSLPEEMESEFEADVFGLLDPLCENPICAKTFYQQQNVQE